MKDPTLRDRITLLAYFLTMGTLVVIVAVAARDVLFERFTFRVGATVASDSDIAYVVGGRSLEGEDYSEILLVDPDLQRIGRAPGLAGGLFGYSAVGTSSGLILLGGTTRQGYSDAIYRFDPWTEKIAQIGALPYSVAYAGAALIANAVYISGGYDGKSRRSEIVRVDPETGMATVVSQLPQPRDGHAAAGYQGRLFVAGGESDGARRLTDLIEIDPETGTVIRSLDFGLPPGNVSMSAIGSRLVIVATDDHNRNLMFTIDLSVPGNKQLIQRTIDLDVRKSALAVADGRLIAIGGVHPAVSRQIGIWAVDPGSGQVDPQRYHSRVWY